MQPVRAPNFLTPPGPRRINPNPVNVQPVGGGLPRLNIPPQGPAVGPPMTGNPLTINMPPQGPAVPAGQPQPLGNGTGNYQARTSPLSGLLRARFGGRFGGF